MFFQLGAGVASAASYCMAYMGSTPRTGIPVDGDDQSDLVPVSIYLQSPFLSHDVFLSALRVSSASLTRRLLPLLFYRCP